MSTDENEKRKSAVLQEELTKLVRPDGTLHPEDILEEARRKTHPLHAYFEWDDTEAAKSYRLDQARDLIRYVRVVVPTPENKLVQVRMFESLPSDRALGNGYRTLTSIMSREDLKSELLASALRELQSFEMRYQHLCELAGVMGEISALRKVVSDSVKTAARKKKRAARPRDIKRPPPRDGAGSQKRAATS